MDIHTAFNSIRGKLTFWFIILGMVPLCAGILITYHQQVTQIKRHSLDKLVAIRNLKVKRLEAWIAQRTSDLRTAAGDTDLLALEQVFQQKNWDMDNSTLKQDIRQVLTRYVNNYTAYNEVFIINPWTGVVEVSSDPHGEGSDRSDRPYFIQPMENRHMYISDVYFSRFSDKNAMAFSLPVFCQKHNHQHIVGILVARIDLENSLYKLLQDRVGLGMSGESLIVNRSHIALNDLRWHAHAPLSLKIQAQPAVNAAEGRTGVIESRDYRGEYVLAAYTHISQVQWGLVVKQDLAELYTPIKEMMNRFIILVLAALTIIIIAAFLTARAMSAPMIQLAQAAREMEAGDLSARGDIIGSDEIADLCRAFNGMAATLESQITLRRINDEITQTLVDAENLEIFRKNILKKLVQVTDSQMGVYFNLDKKSKQYTPVYTIGIMAHRLASFDAATLEGQLGWVADSGQITTLEDLPEDTIFSFRTFTGTIQPRAIITIPIRTDNLISGIISLARIRPYPPQTLEIMKQPWVTGLATGLSNMWANDRTARMARELQKSNQELQSQAEELACQSQELQQSEEELKAQNLTLERQKSQIQTANRMKSEFLSNMSHELRTPLNSVMALSRVLLMQAQSKLTAEELHYLEIIERNGNNLLLLINDILDLSKIEAGRMEIKPTSFSLTTTLDTIVERLAPLAQEKDIDLSCHIPDPLPTMYNDENRISQILQNLIGNAIKFTREGSVSITVTTVRDHVEITVSDTGIGISQAQLPYVFEAFQQADGSASRSYEGTGLGLTIARRAAVMLGGNITVTSKEEEGSCFVLSLPMHHASSPTILPASLPKEAEAPAPIPPQPRKTILVVDDEPDTLEMIAGMLQQEGYHVITATTGDNAIELARTHRPFAITLDIIMPEMDGWELLQHLKKDETTRDIPVIVISVSSDMSTGTALGAVGFVSKPVEKGLLVKEIRNELKIVLERIQAMPVPNTPDPRQKRLLVVEDNESAVIQVRHILERNGYIVDVARGGPQALAYMAHTIPDGIILDLMMPEMDGFQVLEKMRSKEESAHVPVLILTARDLTEEDLKHLSANNVQQLVQKGDIDAQGLLRHIHTMVMPPPDAAPLPAASPFGIEELPPADVPVEEASPSPVPGRDSDTETRSGRPTLLVVEDNPDNRITLKAIFRNRYQLLEAADGKQGLHMALTHLPDLILLDMSLPEMDGYAVVQALKQNETTKAIPVIALTAHAMKGDRDRMIEAGCDDYLSKPVHPKKIVEKIEKWSRQCQKS